MVGKTAKKHPLLRLTPQQMRVLRLCTQGRGNRQIATRLCISQHTVQAHLKNMKEVVTTDFEEGEEEVQRWLVRLAYTLGRAEERIAQEKAQPAL